MPVYTVKAAMPTGKKSPTYGVEYYIQFEEDAGSYALWFKTEPKPGQEIDGNIDGSKFKKVKKEWKPDGKGGAVNPTEKKWTPVRKDNSDGQRQGMCLNNAANYVNTLEFKKALTDREWAELVHSYATALYVLGDLKPNEEITAATVAGVFGAS